MQDEFVFPVTVHPDVSGHPHALMMLERIIEYINTKEGVSWMTMEEICDDFKKQSSPPSGAWLPAEKDAILKNPGELWRCPSLQSSPGGS